MTLEGATKLKPKAVPPAIEESKSHGTNYLPETHDVLFRSLLNPPRSFNPARTLLAMSNTYTDAQQLWPLVNEPLNCSGILGTPIVANTTGKRVCGLQTNRTVIERCCGSAAIQEYQCWLYCESQQSMNDWTSCVRDNVSTISGYGEFCQGDLMSNNIETLTSSGYKTSAPRFGWVILAMLFAFFFVGPTQASIMPSHDGALARRQSSGGCTLNIDQNFTSLNQGSKKVSPSFDCTNTAGDFCAFELRVETLIDGNNRTFNGSSAAETRFDDFFDVVSNATMRRFPAMSSTNFTRGVAVPQGQSFFLGWTPILWCVNGTVTGCSRTLDGATDGTTFEACGPTYVDNGDPESSIQGLLNRVFVG
ncbi:hypothetical protein Slin14017_G094960 [Septoria linicola]|nr:hypothetical protein Slin14017_G094960 [Septoria linicola]